MFLPSGEGRIETPQGPWRTCARLVGELSKTLEYDHNNDEDNDQICMSVKVMVCLCYGF